MRHTPELITELQPNEIFVFGSNLAGRHGAGAAKMALDKFGAVYGRGYGRQGRSFAIPTKDSKLKSLPLNAIQNFVFSFFNDIRLDEIFDNERLIYYVTPIGCGLAGYTPADIAPMFKDAPPNVILPKSFNEILKR